ncbi:unnamed protein product, partial [Mesorhabditis belari]|uniref:CHK kinase-like domain-containing protein n=1 Tax=Mesorhabditis belari TaxID=2138241 RepID=A0AAF3J7B6_9BILA
MSNYIPEYFLADKPSNGDSLNDDSKFILNTPLTWELIEKNLKKSLNTSSTFGQKKTAVKCGDGGGFVSSVILLTFDWTPNSVELPEKAILKVTTSDSVAGIRRTLKQGQDEKQLLLEKAAQIHDNEFFIYSKADQDWEFPSEIGMPKFYCGISFDKVDLKAGYFLVEYIPDVIFVQYYHNLSVSSVKKAVKMIARLTAHVISNQRIVQEHEETTSPGAVAYLEGAYNVQTCHNNLLNMAEKFPKLKKAADLLENLVPIAADFEKRLKECLKYCSYPSLTHFDCHLGNFLWILNGNELSPRAIIDWQTSHTDNPLVDLVRITFTSLSKTDFNENIYSLIKIYYDTLKKYSIEKLPWESYDEFVRSFEHVFPLVATRMAPLFALDQFISMILTKVPVDEHPKAAKNIHEKMEAAIEFAVKCVQKWEIRF